MIMTKTSGRNKILLLPYSGGLIIFFYQNVKGSFKNGYHYDFHKHSASYKFLCVKDFVTLPTMCLYNVNNNTYR